MSTWNTAIWYLKIGNNIYWRKDSFFSIQCWENWMFKCKIMKLDPYTSPCTNIRFNWIKILQFEIWNTKTSTKKIIGGIPLQDTGVEKGFQSRTLLAKEPRLSLGNWDPSKAKSLWPLKKHQSKEEKPHREGETLPALHMTEDLNPEHIKNVKGSWGNRGPS